MTLPTRGAAAALALAAIASPVVDAAQPYPVRPIRLIVPFAPGGTMDVSARLAGQKLTERWGQQVVIDNRTGAAGNIGTELGARANGDGYTLTMGYDGTMTLNPVIFRNLPYDPVRDFTPVSKVSQAPVILVANTALPATSLKELLALSKAKPGTLSFGHPGVGSSPHFAAELLKFRAGVDMTAVPYKGGGPAVADVLAGQPQLLSVAIATVATQIKAGRLRPVVLLAATRTPIAPDVPTAAELGYAGVDVSTWYGIIAPASTPAAIVTRLHAELVRISRLPEVKERYASLGVDAASSESPAQFAAEIRSEIARWRKIVQDTGLKAE